MDNSIMKLVKNYIAVLKEKNISGTITNMDRKFLGIIPMKSLIRDCSPELILEMPKFIAKKPPCIISLPIEPEAKDLCNYITKNQKTHLQIYYMIWIISIDNDSKRILFESKYVD
jgi:hypothetical protein